MERNPPAELIELLTQYPPNVADLFLTAREKVFSLMQDATEIITNASYTLASGYTFTHSIKQAFLYLGAYKKHVNIGFMFGSSLPDPHSRLKGDGKSMRHISIHSHEDPDDPVVDELLWQAILAAHRPAEILTPKTVITVMKKAKAAL